MAGDSEIDQIYRIFRVTGTPTEEVWPGVSSLRDYNPEFPHFPQPTMESLCPTLSADGIDLLKRMLHIDPAKRISAKEALEHRYFSSFVARYKDRL